MDIIGLLIVFPALLATFSLIYWSIKLGIGPVPSSRKVARALSSALPDNINGTIYELGCGWGSLIKVLKKKYPGRAIIGFERSPIPRLVCAWLYRIPVYGRNFFDADLSGASLIVCYLCPQAMKQMAEELLPGLPTGCTIITHTFALPGLKPTSIHRSADIYGSPVYLYRITSGNSATG